MFRSIALLTFAFSLPALAGCENAPAPTHTGSCFEICDGIDNDGDGLVDNIDPSNPATMGYEFYWDKDGDGYGDHNDRVYSCTAQQPPGSSWNEDDCNDADPKVNIQPGCVP